MMFGKKSNLLRQITISIIAVLFMVLLVYTLDFKEEPPGTPEPSIIIVGVDRLYESVTLENITDDDIVLSGWQLVSVHGNQRYTLPDGTILEAQDRLIIASGGGVGDLIWTDEEIWEDTKSDRAELYNKEGKNVYDYDKNIIAEPEPAELPKNLTAISMEWHGEDMLLYHTKDALYAYTPADGITKELLQLELDEGKFFSAARISRYCGSSPDESKYLLLTGTSHIFQVHAADTDELILTLDYQKEKIREAGWFDNENIFLSTWHALYMVNIISGERTQVSEDSSEALLQPKQIKEYLWWAEDIKVIGNKLYYNGVRSFTNQVNGNIYCGDLSGELTFIEDARILLLVDDQRFIYLKEINIRSRVNDEAYEGIFLYNLFTEKSTLITTDYHKRRELFLTDDNKIAFISDKTDDAPDYGVIFDPETLLFQRFEIRIHELLESDDIHNDTKIFQLLGAFREDEAYILLLRVGSPTKSGLKSYAYNSMTGKIAEVEGTRFLFSPSGKYFITNEDTNEYCLQANTLNSGL